ncbi:MAG: esterase/lipase family protein, partial [Thermoflexus sp.]
TPLAQATGSLVLEAVFTSDIQNGWVRVERWQDRNPRLTQEDFLPDGRLDQSGQRETFFGSAQPSSSRFLLYYAPGWDVPSPSVPVLLVHGAAGNADWPWANPGESPLGCGALPSLCPSTGLMQFLSARGYKVFAVSFAHPAGDNFFWAEHIANAIRVIRGRTGASQVDVVAWSKGVIAARMYVSGIRRDWGTPYRGDVRRLILIAGPNGGWDFVFRHGTYPSAGIYPECGGKRLGGAAHTVLNCWGIYYSHPELSIYRTSYGDFFPGIRQFVWPWDDVYPLPWWEPDWWTTYYGGWGWYSYSRGIAEAKVDSLIPALRSNSTPTAVAVYLLCGNKADLPSWHNEHTGPSDGTIFLESCRDRQGLANVQGESVLALNHLRIVWDPTAMAQVEAWLR